MTDDRRVIHEVTPLMGKDVLYIADRHKKAFTYPIHNHEVYELNFVEHAAGARRTVGDSQEVIGEYDLVLITSPNLEHVWEQHECRSDDIREITVQFDFGVGSDSIFARSPFAGIRKMIAEAQTGLSFSLNAIMKVYKMLDTLSSIDDNYYALMQFLSILYELSKCTDAIHLSTSDNAKVDLGDSSKRILDIKNFVSANYKDNLRLGTLADLVGMSPSAFSRFFKLYTGKNISDYIIEVRLNYTSKMLVDSTLSVGEICSHSGFNNLSNFNRIFRREKGCSPTEFRDKYQKKRIIV